MLTSLSPTAQRKLGRAFSLSVGAVLASGRRSRMLMVLSWFAGSPLVAASNSSATANRTHLALPLPDGTASLAGLRRPESLAGSTERLHALMQQLPNMTDMMLRLAAVAVQPGAAVDARVEALLVLQELVEDLDKAC